MHHACKSFESNTTPPPQASDLLFLLWSRASGTPQLQREYNVTLDFMCVMLSGAATLNLFPTYYAVFKFFFPISNLVLYDSCHKMK